MIIKNTIARLDPRRGEPAGAPETVEPPPSAASAELRERRRQLTESFATLQWDLGGLTYEMAIRDHFRLDVLVRVAARLQEVDAELGEVERLLHTEEAGAAGSCSSCGALHGRGATFCWQCGTQLLQSSPAGPGTAFTSSSRSVHTPPPAPADDRADARPLTQETE